MYYNIYSEVDNFQIQYMKLNKFRISFILIQISLKNLVIFLELKKIKIEKKEMKNIFDNFLILQKFLNIDMRFKFSHPQIRERKHQALNPSYYAYGWGEGQPRLIYNSVFDL
jgi:hypothetical protein